MATQKVLAEGKTKIILATDNPHIVHIRSKDDITAGDGARRDLILDKGKIANTTAVNCFNLLDQHPTLCNHFLREVDNCTFAAQALKMIPKEIVMRRIATGSYLKRRPDVAEGTIFPEIVVEFFDKDDARHDPMVIYDFVGGRMLYFDPKKPLATGLIEERPLENIDETVKDVLEMRWLGIETFKMLEGAWAKRGVTLVDLKIECGKNNNSDIMVGDVIDNDSWRIWPAGDKSQMKDKQVYRNMDTAADPAALAKQMGKIKENYAWVAEQTSLFVED